MKEEQKETKNELENPKPEYTLEELLENINEENIHGETDFGESVGKEIVDYEG
jgi:antitoxin component of MazEF toxin-antitoxin module